MYVAFDECVLELKGVTSISDWDSLLVSCDRGLPAVKFRVGAETFIVL